MQTCLISHLARLFPAAWLLLLIMALTACSPFLGRGQQPPELHIFEPGPAALSPAKAGAGPVAIVLAPWAAPGYDTAAMAYQRRAGQLEYFAFHRWADAPARMLQPLLVAALDNTGAFRAVIQAPTPVRGDLVLASELLRLRQFFPEDGQGSLELSLRVQLRAGDTVLATRVFEQSEVTESSDPQGGVAAANRLLEKLLPEIAAFCVGRSQDLPKQPAD